MSSAESSTTSRSEEAIVLGAGAAGLAAAATLQGAGIDTVVLERSELGGRHHVGLRIRD
jgi:phytoene dehydrogenase-like protein